MPSCSTIYLDKPMKNHTLMQTIARANRVLQGQAERPDRGLRGRLPQSSEGAGDLRRTHKTGRWRHTDPRQERTGAPTAGSDLRPRRHSAWSGRSIRRRFETPRGFEREKLKEDAVAAFVVNDETRRQYLNLAAAVDALFKSLLPDAAANEFGPICKVFKVMAEKIRSRFRSWTFRR